MSRARRIERVCGVLAGTLGLLMLVVVLVVPLARHGVDICNGATGATPPVPVTCGATLAPIAPAQAEGLAMALPFLVVYALASVGILLGAVLHVRGSSGWARGLLWVCSVAVLLAAVVHRSLGVYLLPSVVLAAVAALAALAAGEPWRQVGVEAQPV